MREQEIRDKAIHLRKKGFSFAQISSMCNISKSTASAWVRNVVLSTSAQKRLVKRSEDGRSHGQQVNVQKRLKNIAQRIEAVQPIVNSLEITPAVAAICCTLMYWCEGEKGARTVCFANSDPLLVTTFLQLFRRAFTVDEKKFRVCLHLHGYHNEKKQKQFWSAVTGISEKQFLKIYQKKRTGKSEKKGYQGCVSVRYHDVNIAIDIEELWKLFGKQHGRVV